MSVQVSYKKQFIFFGLLLFLVLIIPEQITKTIIPEMEVDSCVNVLYASEAYAYLSIDKINSLCKDYNSLKTLFTDNRDFAMVFPNQNFEHVHINSMGLRGDEIKQENKDHLRIIMIGGSTTFGSKATSDENTIPSQLNILLQSKFNENIEVINAGIGGASSFSEIELIEKKLLKLNPDIIIVYDGWNELMNPIIENPTKNEWKRDTQILLADIESSFYIPRAIEKISHKINSMIYLEIFGKQSVPYVEDTEEMFTKKAKLWSERWSKECKKLSLENIEVHIFLQPILGTGDKNYSKYELKLIQDESLPNLYQYYDLLRNELPNMDKECNSVNDISDVFDNLNDPIYFDLGHTGDLGNKIVAKKIYEKILPVIIKDNQK